MYNSLMKKKFPWTKIVIQKAKLNDEGRNFKKSNGWNFKTN